MTIFETLKSNLIYPAILAGGYLGAKILFGRSLPARKVEGSEVVKVKDITENYKKKEGEKDKYIFVIDIELFDKEESGGLLGGGDDKADNFRKIEYIVNYVLNNVKTDEEIILNINSPGGSVLDYGFVYEQLKRLKTKGYTIRVFVRKVIASGGYLIACVGDEIVVTDTAIVGSIGVYASGFNMSEVIEFLKVKYQKYKAGEFKSLGDMFDKPNEENDKKMQENIDKVYLKFRNIVSKHRKDIDIDKVSTGEVWSGDEALGLKLVDRIGVVDDYLMDKIEKDKCNVMKIYYEKDKKKGSLSKLLKLFI